jgi:hypothetical protein
MWFISILVEYDNSLKMFSKHLVLYIVVPNMRISSKDRIRKM